MMTVSKTFFRIMPVLFILSGFATAGAQHQPRTSVVTADQSVRAEGTQGPILQQRFPRYRLRAGDVLDLNFPFTPEFNQTVTVQPDGYISLRGGGDLHIQDKTVPELSEAVRGAYSKILRDPVITVELKDFEKPYFIVGGEVARPGKYDLRGDTTILQAVTMAGDLKAQSRSSQILLFRRASEDLVEVKQIDLKRILRTKNLTEDTYLRPGDMVFVPKTTLSKFDRFIPVLSLGMFFNPFTF